MDKSILRKWLKTGLIYKGRFQATRAGMPRRGISPTLANMTLNGLERNLIAHLSAKLGIGKAKKLKVNVVQYADDFVISGASREALELEVRP